MNLPENTFIFNMFVYVQHKLLLIFTLTSEANLSLGRAVLIAMYPMTAVSEYELAVLNIFYI